MTRLIEVIRQHEKRTGKRLEPITPADAEANISVELPKVETHLPSEAFADVTRQHNRPTTPPAADVAGFACGKCGGKTSVIDSRSMASGVRRRRACPTCDTRFTTYEVIKEVASIGRRMERTRNKLLKTRDAIDAAIQSLGDEPAEPAQINNPATP